MCSDNSNLGIDDIAIEDGNGSYALGCRSSPSHVNSSRAVVYGDTLSMVSIIKAIRS